jgi:hypothetical protein
VACPAFIHPWIAQVSPLRTTDIACVLRRAGRQYQDKKSPVAAGIFCIYRDFFFCGFIVTQPPPAVNSPHLLAAAFSCYNAFTESAVKPFVLDAAQAVKSKNDVYRREISAVRIPAQNVAAASTVKTRGKRNAISAGFSLENGL